ncbi:hypothetical protein [Aquisphaera insulae]|uniref:hypothetical protein n=1 Tax=Aquisphaera insulae TaxID=2712864 RepID=UPI0013ECDBEE|nr:hypothetical protein [Aquisphaera insulae]
MPEAILPAWLDDARRYYCEIGGPRDTVRVLLVDGDEESPERPWPLRLRLEPASRFSRRIRVLDAEDRERGVISRAGLVPGARYAMRRGDEVVWTLAIRSILLRRHALDIAGGESWTFETPFFNLRIRGITRGTPGLLGGVGLSKRQWCLAIEPGRDTPDLLAAIAFLHRRWWHS